MFVGHCPDMRYTYIEGHTSYAWLNAWLYLASQFFFLDPKMVQVTRGQQKFDRDRYFRHTCCISLAVDRRCIIRSDQIHHKVNLCHMNFKIKC